MPRKPIPPSAQTVDFQFPINGIDLSQAFSQQRPGTTPVGQNVRAFEPSTGRARGGQRPGLAKYINALVSGANFLQELNYHVGAGYSAPDGSALGNLSGRVVTLVAVSNGNIKVSCNTTAWHTPGTISSSLSSSVPIIRSAQNGSCLYFADGVNYTSYSPSTDTVNAWTASAGSLPVDGSSNKPRLICNWNGRIVLSGLAGDAQNVFFSKVNDPTNWDYSPALPTPIQAVALNASAAGLVGDIVTSLVPYNDDVLIIGCDHSLWQMTGDPASGGRLDRISDSIGMCWGNPWARDPFGTLYFMSNRCGIYSMVPNQMPQRISQGIEQVIATIDTGSKNIRMAWNDRMQGLHVFVTALSGTSTDFHYFWEARSGAWWRDILGTGVLNPMCCLAYDGNAVGNRVVLLGCKDGYVRAEQFTATDDDGNAIASAVTLGPIISPDLDDMMLMDIQAVLGTGSGNVTAGIQLGATAEGAAAASSTLTWTWAAGRNLSNFVRRAAHAIYLPITATAAWSMESVRSTIKAKGRIRQRGA